MPDSLTNVAGERLDLPEPTIALSGTTMGGSSFKILGTVMPVLVLNLKPGQTVFTETGALSWMSDNIQMETNMGTGGLGGMLKRALGGESLFVANYTAAQPQNVLAFSSEFPGNIVPVNLAAGQSMIAQKDAFLVAEKTIQLSIALQRKLGSGLVGGEGFILQRFDGPGTFFVAFDGEIVEYTLTPGQVLKVDTGHVAMFEPTVKYEIEMVKGFANILFGGEGLFFAKLVGPGRVWLQSMPMSKLAGALKQFLPAAEKSHEGPGLNIKLG